MRNRESPAARWNCSVDVRRNLAERAEIAGDFQHFPDIFPALREFKAKAISGGTAFADHLNSANVEEAVRRE
jgi:hypothetical protein